MRTSDVVIAAENKFGQVVAVKQISSAEFFVTIKRDNPVFADAPFMQISAYKSENGIAFERGHYDLTAAQIA